jgi:branched-subunit amino acid transport protein
MSETTTWIAILVCSAGSFGLKLVGQSLPSRVLQIPRVARLAALVPIALLAALTAVLTFGDGRALTIDARALGVLAAVVALLLRAPFLVVVLVAAGSAALARATFG